MPTHTVQPQGSWISGGTVETGLSMAPIGPPAPLVPADRHAVPFRFENQAPFDVTELAGFLTAFNAIYACAIDVIGNAPVERVLVDRERYMKEILARLPAAPASDRFCEPDDPRALVCTRISFSSPLEIALAGEIPALVAAFIFCGGEVRFFGAVFKLQSLGKALMDLRKVFERSQVIKSAKPEQEESAVPRAKRASPKTATGAKRSSAPTATPPRKAKR